MFRYLLAFSVLVLAIISITPIATVSASNTISPNQQQTNLSSVSIDSSTPKVLGSNIIFPITIHNDHPYLIPAVSLTVQQIDHQYLKTTPKNSSVTVNGKALIGNYASTLSRSSYNDSLIDLEAHSSQSTTITIPLLEKVSSADFQILAVNRAGESIGISKMINVPFGQTTEPTPSVSIQNISLIDSAGHIDASGLGLIAASNGLPALKLTLFNASNSVQSVIPQVTYYKLEQSIVDSKLSTQKFDAVDIAPLTTRILSYSLKGNFAPQKYQLRVSLVNNNGTELLPEKSVQLLIKGESAVIHTIILNPTSVGRVSGEVYVSGPADMQTSLRGSLRVWLTNNSHPNSVVTQEIQPLPDFSNKNTAVAVPFTLTHLALIGDSKVTMHAEVLSGDKTSLDVFVIPAILQPQYTIAQLVEVLLGMLFVIAVLYFLIHLLRTSHFQGHTIQRSSAILIVLGLLLFPIFSSPTTVSADQTTQLTPISSDLSAFVAANTGIGIGSSALGAAKGPDAYSTVSTTSGNTSGGMAISSIEVAPGWGGQWSFAHDIVDYSNYTRVPCKTNSSAWFPVDPYITSDGVTHNWKYIPTTDVCNGYGAQYFNYSYFQNSNPTAASTSIDNSLDCLGYGLNGNISCIGVTSGNIAGNSPRFNGLPTQYKLLTSDPYCLDGSGQYNSPQCPGRTATVAVDQLENRTPLGPLCDKTITYPASRTRKVATTYQNVPIYDKNFYTSACYVDVPNVQLYNPDALDRPFPLYGAPSDGSVHNFYRDFAFPAVNIDLESQDLMPCAQDPAFIGKYNIDSNGARLQSQGLPYPSIQPYSNLVDNTPTAYIVTEAMRGGSLRVYVAACIHPKVDGSPGTAKIGFNARSDEFKNTTDNKGTDDPNGYTRKLVNSWTFTHSGYKTYYDSGFYTWGDNLSDGNKADRSCLGAPDSGTDGNCYNAPYTSSRMDGDIFFNPSWVEADPNTTLSATNNWIAYQQNTTTTCTQFVVSSATAPYTGSSNPSLLMPPNNGYDSLAPMLSSSDFNAKYGRDCSAIPPIGTTSTGVPPTVALTGSQNSTSEDLTATATEQAGAAPTSLKINEISPLQKQGVNAAPASTALLTVPRPTTGSVSYQAFVVDANGSAQSTVFTIDSSGVITASPSITLTGALSGNQEALTATATQSGSLSMLQVTSFSDSTPIGSAFGTATSTTTSSSVALPVAPAVYSYYQAYIQNANTGSTTVASNTIRVDAAGTIFPPPTVSPVQSAPSAGITRFCVGD